MGLMTTLKKPTLERLREGGPPRDGPGEGAIPPRERGLAGNLDQRLAPAAPDTGHAGHGACEGHAEAHDQDAHGDPGTHVRGTLGRGRGGHRLLFGPLSVLRQEI